MKSLRYLYVETKCRGIWAEEQEGVVFFLLLDSFGNLPPLSSPPLKLIPSPQPSNLHIILALFPLSRPTPTSLICDNIHVEPVVVYLLVFLPKIKTNSSKKPTLKYLKLTLCSNHKIMVQVNCSPVNNTPRGFHTPGVSLPHVGW